MGFPVPGERLCVSCVCSCSDLCFVLSNKLDKVQSRPWNRAGITWRLDSVCRTKAWSGCYSSFVLNHLTCYWITDLYCTYSIVFILRYILQISILYLRLLTRSISPFLLLCLLSCTKYQSKVLVTYSAKNLILILYFGTAVVRQH